MNKTLSFREFAGFFRLIWRSLLHRKLRASLTVVGIVIGISVVVALQFLGDGLRVSVTSQLRQFGSDLIFAFPHDISNPVGGLAGGGEFNDRHWDAIRDAPGVVFVMPTVEAELVKGEFNGEKKAIALHAQPWELIAAIFEESQGFRIREGSWPVRENAREVVLGDTFAQKAFKSEVRTGDTLSVRGRNYRVAGVLAKTGEQNHDNSVFVSLEALKTLTGKRGAYSAFIIKIERGADPEAASEGVSDILRRQKDLEEFAVLTPDKAGRIVSNVIGAIELVLFLVAAVAVVIGGVGIMNTMYTSVVERTREIGIMKAVGAGDRQVLALFLLESGLIGTIGGAVGVVGGAGLAALVAAAARARGFAFFESGFSAGTVLWMLAFALIIGAVSGVAPARQAARLKPADALRHR